MAPHWKCGSRQRVAGSNPALSAIWPAMTQALSGRRLLASSAVQEPQVIAHPMGEFTFRDDDPWPGQTGVVVAYAVRHPAGILLFYTGIGLGNAEFDAYYM